MNQTTLQAAEQLLPQLQIWRRWLHQHPEIGFDLNDTLPYVKGQLIEMGLAPRKCGKAGLVAVIKGSYPGGCTLLRADMDGLKIKEETPLPFCAENGSMHACGHDLHTAMLLGAAKLILDRRDQLYGQVVLMFQPAEEILQGAQDMLNDGLLDVGPQRALALHVMTGSSLPAGTAIIPPGGITAPGAQFFSIRIRGNGCHGSSPWLGTDSLNAAVHLHLALQAVLSREVSPRHRMALTIGSIQGGRSGNVIPDETVMLGSLRAYSSERLTWAKGRISSMTEHIAAAFRCTGSVKFERGCPPLFIDPTLREETIPILQALLGTTNVVLSGKTETDADETAGSEDFSYISQKLPSLLLTISAGSSDKGFSYPLHHPKVMFDERVLPIGASVLAECVLSSNVNIS